MWSGKASWIVGSSRSRNEKMADVSAIGTYTMDAKEQKSSREIRVYSEQIKA
jgi:hypothetical protein